MVVPAEMPETLPPVFIVPTDPSELVHVYPVVGVAV